MSAPTAEERFEGLWKVYSCSHEDMVSFEGDGAVFAPGTPREVLDSYEFWVERRKAAGVL